MLTTFFTLALAGSSVLALDTTSRLERFRRIRARHGNSFPVEREIGNGNGHHQLAERAASSSNWTYMGCVTDDATRALTGKMFSSSSMTIGACTAFCDSAGFTYAGVEYSNQCYCGNSLASGHSSTIPTNCQMPCSGDKTTTCGGSWFIGVYSKPKAAPTLQGCYRDNTPRLLTGATTSSPQMTPNFCANFCGTQGFAFAGVEYGKQCYCGSSVNASAAAPDGDCSMPCAGDSSQTCGGSWRINVYQLPPCSSGTTTNCQAGTTASSSSSSSSSSTTSKTSSTTTTKASTTTTTTTTTTTKSSTTTTKSSTTTTKSSTTTTKSSTTTTTTKASTTTSTTTTKATTTTTSPTTSPKPSTTTTTTNTSTPTTTAAAFATAVVTGVANPPAASGQKYVWAHHMVGNTYSYTQSTWADDISLAKAAGIDGFALNFGSDYWQPARLADAYAAAEAAGGFKLFLSLDVTSLSCSSTSDGQNLGGLTAQFANSSAQAFYKGGVLVSTFSGDGCNFGQSSPSAGWAYFKSQVAAKSGNNGTTVFLLPAIFSDPSQYSSSQYSWLDGEFNWNSGWPMGDDPISTSSDQQYMAGLGSKPYMPAISPAFFTYYGPNSWNKDWIYRSDDWLLATRFEQVIQMRAQVDMTEIISWNDYGESHYIGPIRQDQPMSQGWTNGMPHTAWLDLVTFYAAAFKTGSYPSTSDSIHLWSRPHPKAANPTNPTAPRPTNWQDTDDNLYALIMLSSPATVQVYSGGNNATWNLQKGVNKISIASDAGVIGASISRGGKVVSSYDSTGDFTYVLVPVDFNYNYFVASA